MAASGDDDGMLAVITDYLRSQELFDVEKALRNAMAARGVSVPSPVPRTLTGEADVDADVVVAPVEVEVDGEETFVRPVSGSAVRMKSGGGADLAVSTAGLSPAGSPTQVSGTTKPNTKSPKSVGDTPKHIHFSEADEGHNNDDRHVRVESDGDGDDQNYSESDDEQEHSRSNSRSGSHTHSRASSAHSKGSRRSPPPRRHSRDLTDESPASHADAEEIAELAHHIGPVVDNVDSPAVDEPNPAPHSLDHGSTGYQREPVFEHYSNTSMDDAESPGSHHRPMSGLSEVNASPDVPRRTAGLPPECMVGVEALHRALHIGIPNNKWYLESRTHVGEDEYSDDDDPGYRLIPLHDLGEDIIPDDIWAYSSVYKAPFEEDMVAAAAARVQLQEQLEAMGIRKPLAPIVQGGHGAEGGAGAVDASPDLNLSALKAAAAAVSADEGAPAASNIHSTPPTISTAGKNAISPPDRDGASPTVGPKGSASQNGDVDVSAATADTEDSDGDGGAVNGGADGCKSEDGETESEDQGERDHTPRTQDHTPSGTPPKDAGGNNTSSSASLISAGDGVDHCDDDGAEGYDADGNLKSPRTQASVGTGPETSAAAIAAITDAVDSALGTSANVNAGVVPGGVVTVPAVTGAPPTEGDEHTIFYDCFDLKIVYERDRTGFEEHKDFPIKINSVIAGRYQILEYLGSAAFSKAVQCVDLHDLSYVCIKIIKNNKDFFDQSLDEIKLLKYINAHDPEDSHNVLQLYDYFYFKEHLFIVTELLRENLYEFSKFNRESEEENYFTMPRMQRIARQCMEACSFVHGLGLIHCDLKPENILIRSYSRCEVKMIDFGSSCFTTDHLTSYVQSRSYRAPEVILGLPYDQRIDMWSMGCILAELWTNKVLFQNDSVATLLGRVAGIVGPFKRAMLQKARYTNRYFTNNLVLYERAPEPEGQVLCIIPKRSTLADRLHTDDDLFLDFISRLLKPDPEERLTADEALRHPWLHAKYATA